MKLAPQATGPATRYSAAPQLIEYDLVAAAQLIEHDLAELIARIEALQIPTATRETKLRCYRNAYGKEGETLQW